ncbi:MAG: site-2 protease family protein [Gammaproteobacteria bacterium]
MPALVIAIVFHEVAHGWTALALGDPTAKEQRRLSLNPIRHVDPVGTLLVPGFLALVGGPIFGWAKPVPVTWENLKHPKRDMALVAAAGPLSNLLMALFWVIMLRIGIGVNHELPWLGAYLFYAGQAGIVINLVLMVLNLLPLPPLDGGRVVSGLLPGPWSWQLNRIEPYGLLVLLLLLMSGVLGNILGPVIDGLQSLLYFIVGLRG